MSKSCPKKQLSNQHDGDNEPRLEFGTVEKDASDSVEESSEKVKERVGSLVPQHTSN